MRFAFIFLFLLSACAVPDVKVPTLKPVSYSKLPGWLQDDHQAALEVFKKSCARILKRPADRPFGKQTWQGTYDDWQIACKKALSPVNAKRFFETYFTPHQIKAGRADTGLFTGYYQPLLNGSRTQYGPFQTPLRKKPDDLVMVQLGDFREDLSGRRIAGRVINGRLKPYESREEITQAAPHNDDVLAWVNDPVDAFFLHIQGSGRINLNDGSVMYAGYAGQNGHPYYAIGRALIEREEIKKEDISLQTIRAWLQANPNQAEDLMNRNASYVYFKELDIEGAIGGEGVPITAERSLAIDHSIYPYGLPIWVDLEHPSLNKGNIQRLMIAQDTGGAIRGVIRGDYFWGHGHIAEQLAGQMKSEGAMWVLLPKIIKIE